MVVKYNWLLLLKQMLRTSFFFCFLVKPFRVRKLLDLQVKMVSPENTLEYPVALGASIELGFGGRYKAKWALAWKNLLSENSVNKMETHYQNWRYRSVVEYLPSMHEVLVQSLVQYVHF